MASKNIGKFLSDGTLVLCVILLCALSTGVHAIEGMRVTYTISGSTGVGGVTMNGLPGNPVTDAGGNYSVTVDWGWKGTVRPELAGYTFNPPYINYPKVTSNQLNQDYVATIEQFTISGIVRMDGAPMEGVIIEGLPGAPTTGSDGTYKASVPYDWGGMVMPVKDGYIFTPGNNSYTSVTRDMPNQNYTGAVVTYEISGSVGAEGVVMNGLPGNTVSDRDGNYSAAVRFGWSGIVRPEKDGYTFEPAEMPYNDVMSPYPNQDYFANQITFTISGSAEMDNVEMKGFPNTVFTGMDGYYTATVPWGWSGTVRPDKPGYKFEDPATINYTKVIRDKTEQNYTPTPVILTISGSVGMEGVTMDGLPENPVTGAGGSFSADVPWGWTGMVTPVMNGYEFTPSSKPYTNITNDQTNQRFVAKQITFTISGSVGTSGVTMKGAPGRPVVSGADGSYTIEVPYGWSGTITPMKAGSTFTPSDMQYSSLYNNEFNQDYFFALEKQTISGTIRSDKGDFVQGVFVIADPGGGSTETDADGRYELAVDYGWRGTITPTKVGHNFTPPAKRQMSPVTRDLANQNFNAIVQMFTITDVVRVGGTGIQGVKVRANNGGTETVTNAQGRFTVQVPYDWTGEIELEKEGFQFPSKPYANITQNMVEDMPEDQYRRLPRPGAPQPTPELPTGQPGTPTPTIPDDSDSPFPGLTRTAPPARTTDVEGERGEMTETEKILVQLEELLNRQQQPVVIEPNEIVPDMPLISNVFVEEDIITALNAIATAANVTIIPDETITGSVNCKLENVPLDTALNIVLAGTPYVVKKTPYYYLVCSGGINDSQFSKVSETHRVTMSYITADAAVGLLSPAFTDYVKAEVGRPGTSTYTVVVTATPELAQRIISDLKKIDRIPTQVLLDARIVVMESGDLLNMGIEWGLPTINGGYFSSDLHGRGGDLLDLGGKIAGAISIGYTPDATFTNSLVMALNLLAENDEATIMAKPQVMAQDGKRAEINVMTEEYYMLTSPETNTYYYSRSELETITSGTKLSIVPHIGDNNDITLDLAVEVSDSIAQGRGNDLPVVTRRTSTNTVSIKNGGTVAVAGLTENRTRLSKQEVPGFSKIPIIGALFKNKSDTKADREIAVFVTAYIIPDSRPNEFTQQPVVQQTPTIESGMGAADRLLSDRDRVPAGGTRVPGSRIIAPGSRSRRMTDREPIERDFKSRLRDSLSRSTR
jgi:hypothetical protein